MSVIVMVIAAMDPPGLPVTPEVRACMPSTATISASIVSRIRGPVWPDESDDWDTCPAYGGTLCVSW
jgi:hypothetical protein